MQDQNILEPELLQKVESVQYLPCITAIAVYSAEARSQLDQLGIQGIQFLPDDPIFGWIGIEHTKQRNPTQGLLILQGSQLFIQEHFESPDLMAVGQKLCDRARELFQIPIVSQPEKLQVHRWKYAFPIQFLPQPYLVAHQTPHPLYCIGDWCGGNRLESAFLSGGALVQSLLHN